MEAHFEEQDYWAYVQAYEEAKTKRFKSRPDATKPGSIEHFGPPLDFSFLKLQEVQSLRKENPRAGKRKPIEKDEDEEDTKKGDATAFNGEEKGDGDGKPKEAQGSLVVKNTAVPQVQNILASYSVSLQ